MTQGPEKTSQRFVTAEEAAAVLRVTLNTVYRWCRAGRLRARKFGHEWRIDSSALGEFGDRGARRPDNLLEPLLRHIGPTGEHLFGLAPDVPAERRLEAMFLDLALGEPGRAVYLGLWDESPEEATLRLCATMAPHGGNTGALHFLSLGQKYEASGLDGILDVLEAVTKRAEERGEQIWATGTPQRFFGANMERLLEYERALGELAAGGSAIAMCTYEHTTNRELFLRSFFSLTDYHSGLVYFDGWHRPYLLLKYM
jgi:excisionase family DNA binding protein